MLEIGLRVVNISLIFLYYFDKQIILIKRFVVQIGNGLSKMMEKVM